MGAVVCACAAGRGVPCGAWRPGVQSCALALETAGLVEAHTSSLALTVAAPRVACLIHSPLSASSVHICHKPGDRAPRASLTVGDNKLTPVLWGSLHPPPLLLTSKRLWEQNLLGLGIPTRPWTVCPADAIP